MATSVVEIGQDVGLSEAEVVGTAMLTLTVATFVVGVMTWLVGEHMNCTCLWLGVKQALHCGTSFVAACKPRCVILLRRL
jgi:hypothetical protein